MSSSERGGEAKRWSNERSHDSRRLHMRLHCTEKPRDMHATRESSYSPWGIKLRSPSVKSSNRSRPDDAFLLGR